MGPGVISRARKASTFLRLCLLQELELLGVPDSRDAATPRKKQALPRPVEIEKPAGCSGAKLAADSIDTPLH